MRFRRRQIAWLVLIGAAGVTIGLVAARHHTEPVRADNAVGDSTCLGCHTAMASFEQTAHRLTSTLPTRASIQGRFNPGENVLRTANPNLYFRMDSTATGFYETAVQGHAPDTSIRRERIDIVTGVRKGQSYLYWRGDRLYQQPVSHWAGFGWTNSRDTGTERILVSNSLGHQLRPQVRTHWIKVYPVISRRDRFARAARHRDPADRWGTVWLLRFGARGAA